jgi:environmental stress-induced protein Ves
MEANEHRLALQLNLNAGQPLTFFADTRLTYQNLLLTVQDLNLKTRRKNGLVFYQLNYQSL